MVNLGIQPQNLMSTASFCERYCTWKFVRNLGSGKRWNSHSQPQWHSHSQSSPSKGILASHQIWPTFLICESPPPLPPPPQAPRFENRSEGYHPRWTTDLDIPSEMDHCGKRTVPSLLHVQSTSVVACHRIIMCKKFHSVTKMSWIPKPRWQALEPMSRLIEMNTLLSIGWLPNHKEWPRSHMIPPPAYLHLPQWRFYMQHHQPRNHKPCPVPQFSLHWGRVAVGKNL